jgi:hypothetical protein
MLKANREKKDKTEEDKDIERTRVWGFVVFLYNIETEMQIETDAGSRKSAAGKMMQWNLCWK